MTGAPGWAAMMPAAADAGYWALKIQRHVTPRDWPDALQHVPDAHRPGAEAALRTAAGRMRAARKTAAPRSRR